MLKSMTGYASEIIENENGRYTIEISSVNRRFLESSIFLPKDLSSIEIELKKILSKKLSRGQISLKIFFQPIGDKIKTYFPDVDLLKKLKKGWEEISSDLSLDNKGIDINFLYQHLKDIPNRKEKDITLDKKTVIEGLNLALEKLNDMRKGEGDVLAKDIKERLLDIKKIIKEIEDIAKDSKKSHFERLNKNLEELLQRDISTDERILKEIAIYAEKLDIAEEIVRLKAHISLFNDLVNAEEPIGRKLDFLLQEMIREANTIASKSNSDKISSMVVDIKSQLERIKEQIQNIE